MINRVSTAFDSDLAMINEKLEAKKRRNEKGRGRRQGFIVGIIAESINKA